MRLRRIPVLAIAAGTMALAACGSSTGNGYGGAPAAKSSPHSAAAAAGALLAVKSGVLVDHSGNTLYSPEQERNGTIKCMSSCTQIWPPATVSGGATVPTSVPGAHGKVGTIKRPDGTRQLTFNGAPLYTFTLDGGPGTVKGDGTSDSFDGTSFTWHAVRTAGAKTPPSSPASNGGNGYNY